MTELGVRLNAEILAKYAKKLTSDKTATRLARRAEKSADYAVANEYAVRAGELLGDAVAEATKGVQYLTIETAQQTVIPALQMDYQAVATITNSIQTNMNANNGIGLAAVTPAFDSNRANGLAVAMAGYSDLGDAERWYKEAIVNYSQSVADKAIQDNAKANSKAGIKAYITRETGEHETREAPLRIRRGNKVYTYARKYTVPCKWCNSLAGTYEYDAVKNTGNNVYRRHEACRCKVTYRQGTRVVDVWSKKEWTQQDRTEQLQAVAKAEEAKSPAYYPQQVAGADRGAPMTFEQADSGNVNPNYYRDRGYQINCQSCVVTLEARLRGYDVEVLPNTRGSMLETLSYHTELAWKNADGTPAQYLINRKAMNGTRFYTATTYEQLLHETLKTGERYNFSFAWAGRSNSGHIVTMDISADDVLHIYDPQVNRDYYGDEVSAYLKRIKYKRTFYGTPFSETPEIMRVDDKLFNMDVVNNIMKAK